MKTISRTILAVAALAACSSVNAKSIFGCDFDDCSNAGVPTVGGGGPGATGSYTTGGDGTVGVSGSYTLFKYDYDLQTFIDPLFTGLQWTPQDPCAFNNPTACPKDRVTVFGNRNDVLWTFTFDPNTQQAAGGGLRWPSSDWGTRLPDRDAALRPPNNDSKERCKETCDKIQKVETNLCTLRGSEIGVVSWLGAQAGAIYLGTTAGTATAAATPVTGGAAAVAAIPVGLLVYKQGADIFVPIADQLTTKWTNLCTARANDRWTYCTTVTCAWVPFLAAPFIRRRRKDDDQA